MSSESADLERGRWLYEQKQHPGWRWSDEPSRRLTDGQDYKAYCQHIGADDGQGGFDSHDRLLRAEEEE